MCSAATSFSYRNRSVRADLRRSRRSSGQALVPVIFIMLILTTLVVGFEISASRELRSGANFAAQTQRFYIAKGALQYAASALSQTSANGATYGIVPAGPDTDSNGWMQVGDGWVKIDAIDTAGLINLNSVDQTVLAKLPVFRDNPDIAAAIVDWRTPATTMLPNGAKSDYYNTLSPPYDCKCANYESVDELLLVKGMTPTILFNSAAGTAIDPDSIGSSSTTALPGIGAAPTRGVTRQAAGGAGGAGGGAGGAGGGGAAAGAAAGEDWTDIYSNSNIPLSELFTIVGRERNVAADGTLRVNIQTASAQDIQDKLGLSAGVANRIVRARTPVNGGGGGPGSGPPTPTPTQTGGGVPPRPASRQAPGTSGAPGASGGGGAPGGGGGAPGGGGGATTGFTTLSAFMLGAQLDRTTYQQIIDHVAIDDQPYHENLVNINTASPEVLATVPGMDHATLQAIVNYRQGGNVFQSLGDLFGIQEITNVTSILAIIDHICTKSSVYRVRIRVAMPGQQSIYAISALVEMTDYGPRIRQWREVTRDPGWTTWVPAPQLPTPAPPAATGSTGNPVTTGNTN